MKRPVISLSGVGVTIGRRKVLEGVSWDVLRGECWAVIGPNGAGKTTLLSIINGYRWPSQGTISVLGRRFGRTDLRELRTEIGFVSSHVDKMVGPEQTVLHTVLAGRHGATRIFARPTRDEVRYARRTLDLMGCRGYGERLMGELSQGERQKVLISRALMARPKLLVLDEPCEGLDLPARESLLDGLAGLAKRRREPIIDVTHRTEEIPEGFTHALIIKKGTVLAKGRIEDVLNGANLSSCFELDVEVLEIGRRFYTVPRRPAAQRRAPGG